MTDLDISLAPDRLAEVRDGAVMTLSAPTVLLLRGTGAVECLQGLLTSDVAKAGPGSLSYGAILTPKGMILLDIWTIRRADDLILLIPASARETALEHFRRTIPPRLAQITDLTGAWRALWTFGADAFARMARSALAPLPDGSGRVIEQATPAGPVDVALAPEAASFTGLVLGDDASVEAAAGALLQARFTIGTEADLAAARILAGWPALEAEIDQRTLPQEVRYDELGGVSYTKGCYTGQETVARVHFRGHPNRELRGLMWPDAGPLDGRAIKVGEREVGTVRSTLAVGHRRIGLAPIRREVNPGDEVTIGGSTARVVRLPFPADALRG